MDDMSMHPSRPIFDDFRPTSTAPKYNQNPPMDRLDAALNAFTRRPRDPFLGAPLTQQPPRPPGSYERLRPPRERPS